jgi:hypothetical protein
MSNEKVVIVDCEKAGIIGGPFSVIVVRDGKHIASRSGLRSLERAEQVAAELRSVYARRAA